MHAKYTYSKVCEPSFTRASRRVAVRSALALGAFGASLLSAHVSRAQQTDVNPPLPNVMLLLDSSGSMEMMADGTDPDANSASKCTIGTSSLANRWGTAVQALTGEISGPSGQKYSCVTQPRNNVAFQNEYGIAGVQPYDYNYYLGFHRPASGTCVVTPGKLPGLSTASGGAGGLATDFNASTSIVTRDYNTGVTGCSFTQVSDGALDSALDILRFGLMTFDSDPSASTGVTTGASPVVNTLAPFAGMWSYFPGWNTGTASAFTGHPVNCLTDSLYEVGAKNPAAPPWEGRLMPLPSDPNATIAVVEQANNNIQLVINAMRPYGATPTAAMLQDLKNYYWSDTTGPQVTDPYVQGNCRDEYAILLTDGAPNLDLRPYCTPEGDSPLGHCPYSLPEDIAAQLYAGNDGKISGHKVITYVVGFNVNTIADTTPVDCSTLAATPTQFAAVCADPTKQALYGSCCSLEKVAFSGSGGTQSAFFVKTQTDLLNALNVIISKIAKNTTARTTPSYSPNVATVNNDPNTPITNGSVYLASFQPLIGQTWSGDVTRQRYVCDSTQTLTQPTPDPTQGDDFSKDLNSGAGGAYATRQFSVIQPATVSGTTDALATIRPFATGTDGLGTYGGIIVAPTDASTAMTTLTPDALQINTKSCPNLTNTEWLTTDSCKKLAVNFAVGSATTDAMPDATFTAFVSRQGNAFGDIFHATPTVIGPPNAVIRDGSYESFAATYAKRPTVLYAATNDGLLHAFNTGVAAQQNNEMWAMFPPAVLPKLLSVYPEGHTLMLDGPPVVKDVVLDRTQAQIGDPTRWHTMLVAGFGSSAQGYYAVDITDPDQRTPVVAGGTPQFRWQLTKMPGTETKQIFGQRSSTPAITTIFADLGDGSGAHEVGVAILPGGTDGSPTTSTACARDTDTSDAPLSSSSLASPPNNTFPARTQVQCWSGNGRSVSVVRLDTGEIIRTFMRTADAPAAIITSKKLRPTPLDSPMTGVPVVYPTDVGAIAQRAYVGDADGTMWRFDLTNQNPDLWTGSLFVDAYNTDPNVVTPTPYADGQPIAVPPTVAIDDVGNVVVSFATGDQETYTATGYNFVYSVTEKLSTTSGVSSLRGNVNWFLRFINGQRVSGPMAVFDETLYFATFAAPANTAVCTLGAPTLYGRDFEIPEDSSTLSLGGLPRLNPSSVAPIPQYIDPTNGSSSSPFAGKIIPGVSINITPTCSNTSVGVNDSYVPGATHYLAQNVNAGSPSLFAQVGGQNASGQPLSVSVSLPRPATVTSVDSWAAVVE